jgi:hypothetical protein
MAHHALGANLEKVGASKSEEILSSIEERVS